MALYLTIALRNLLQARRRTSLLVTALALVTILLMLLLSLSRGLSETMIRTSTAIASGHVNVAGWWKAKQTDAWPTLQDVRPIRKIIEDNSPGLDYVVARDRAWAKVISEYASIYVSPSGVDIEDEARLPEVLEVALESDYKEGGRDERIGDVRRLSEPNAAVIFVQHAKRLRVEVGDYLTLTAPTGAGRTNTVDLTVVAVAEDLGFMSNWNLFLPRQAVHELYQTKEHAASVAMIYLKDPSKAEETMGHLREVFAREGHVLMDHQPAPFFMKFETVAGEDWTGQKLDLTIWSDEISFLQWMTAAIDAISFFLVAILLALIAVGIMNSMWISVRERTGEVGMVRAIGMKRHQVLLVFLTEALLLGLMATTLGAVVGAGLALGIDAAGVALPSDAVRAILISDTLHLSVSPWHGVGAVAAFTLVTGVSAAWPALRASRLEPVTAIHHTG